MLQAVACAHESIAVMSPYFLPDEALITALVLAAMRGVEIDIVIPEKSNHALVDWGTRANVGPLLTEGNASGRARHRFTTPRSWSSISSGV